MTKSKSAEWARVQHWITLVIQANNCGKTKIQWCRENGISRDQFYYWQRKIRLMALNHQLDDDLMTDAVISSMSKEKEDLPVVELSDRHDTILSQSVAALDAPTHLSEVKSITSTMITEAKKSDFYEIPFPSESQCLIDTETPLRNSSEPEPVSIQNEAPASRQAIVPPTNPPAVELIHGDTILHVWDYTSPETLEMVMAVIRNA